MCKKQYTLYILQVYLVIFDISLKYTQFRYQNIFQSKLSYLVLILVTYFVKCWNFVVGRKINKKRPLVPHIRKTIKPGSFLFVNINNDLLTLVFDDTFCCINNITTQLMQHDLKQIIFLVSVYNTLISDLVIFMLLSKLDTKIKIVVFSTEIAVLWRMSFLPNCALKICGITKVTHLRTAASEKWFLQFLKVKDSTKTLKTWCLKSFVICCKTSVNQLF